SVGELRARLKQAEEALQKAQDELSHAARLAAMSEIAGSLIHELNQALTAVGINAAASVRWLSRAEPEVREAVNALNRILANAKQAGEVIAYTSLLLKNSDGQKMPVDIADVVRGGLILVRAELTSQRIVL